MYGLALMFCSTSKCLLEKSARPKPVRQDLGPLRQRLVLHRHAGSMRAVLEDVHFCRHSGFPQREEIVDAVLDRHCRVGVRVKEECRRRFGVDLGLCGKMTGHSRIGRLSEQVRFRSLMRPWRSEEHTSELQSRLHLVCRLLLEKKKEQYTKATQMTLIRD